MSSESSTDPEQGTELPVLVNPAAGRDGGGTARRLQRLLADAGVRASVRPTPPDRLQASAAEMVKAGVPRLGAAGGDGSLRAVATALVGSDTVLVPFPAGTLNHFARRHGLPTLEAAAAAVHRQPVRVPAGVLDDGIFLNTATFGYYAEVVRRRERLRPWLMKWPAAVVSLATLTLRWPRFTVELDFGSERVRRTTSLVWVGIGWGSFPRTPDAAERRGEPDLEVAVLRVPHRRALLGLLLRLIPSLFRGERPIDDPALELFHTRSLIVRSPTMIDATLDGEPFRVQPPLFVAVQDAALLIAAGPEDDPD